MFLRCYVHDTPTLWRKWLPLAEFWYNSTYHSAIGSSPFKALYGCEPNLGLMPVMEEDNLSQAALMLRDRKEQMDILKRHLPYENTGRSQQER
jgi:hypothetical protein